MTQASEHFVSVNLIADSKLSSKLHLKMHLSLYLCFEAAEISSRILHHVKVLVITIKLRARLPQQKL